MRDGFKRVFTLDVRSIALLRISTAAVLLWDTFDRMRHLSDHYFATSAIPFEVAEEYYKFFPTWSLHLLSEAPVFQTSLFVLQMIAAGLLLIGFYGRITAGICWILFASVLARVPPLLTGGDMLLCSLLFWLTLLPCSKCFSVHSKGKASPGSVYSVATAALLIQFVIMYTLTGIFKCNSQWVTGDALLIILSDTGLAKPVGAWLTHFPGVLKLLTWSSLILELAAQVLLLSPWQTSRVRTIGIISYIGLHVGIFLTMEVLVFSIISIAGLCALIPTSWWHFKPLAKLTRPAANPEIPPPRIQSALPRISTLIGAWGLALIIAVASTDLYTYATGTFVDMNIKWVAHQLRFDQKWTMFNHPNKLCYRIVAEVRTGDGKYIDILRSRESRKDSDKIPQIPVQFQSSRWLLLYRQIVSDQYYLQRIHTVRYLTKHNPALRDLPTAEEIDGKEIKLFVSVGSETYRNSHEPRLLAYLDLRATGNYVLGEPHGYWKQHGDDGLLQSAGSYDQGLREGEWKYYHPNGKVIMVGCWKDGLEHGEWTMWDEDGSRTASGFYQDGSQEGTWTYWYENGEMEQEVWSAGERVDQP